MHSHKCGVFKSQDVLAFETVQLFLGNTWVSDIYGSAAGMASKYPRLGDYTQLDDPYTMLDYTKPFNAFLQFKKSSVTYAKGVCTCGGAYAENMLVTFRDGRAPAIDGAYFSIDGGKEQNGSNQVYVGKGQTLTIRLHFDEPIRFADDSAAHGDLELTLRARGVAGDELNPKAKLTKLEGNNLYFTYTVDGSEGALEILELGLGGLYVRREPAARAGHRRQILHAHRDGEERFQARLLRDHRLHHRPRGQPHHGRALQLRAARPRHSAPADKNFVFTGYTGNDAVKAALGKTDPTSESYPDASDEYLGEGDSLQIAAIFDEVIDLAERLEILANAVAVTNIIVDGELDRTLGGQTVTGLGTREIDGVNYLTVDSIISNRTEDGANLVFSTIPIHANLRAADADGAIRVSCDRSQERACAPRPRGQPVHGRHRGKCQFQSL